MATETNQPIEKSSFSTSVKGARNEFFHQNWLGQQIRDFLVALQFLTRLPTPRDLGVDAIILARSVTFFPLVGLVLTGIIALVVTGVLASDLDRSLGAALLLTALTLATGAFHEDGLADSADGLGGGITVAKKLEIMRDSRIGTYGAISLILLYLIRFTALCSIPPEQWVNALGIALIWGRWTTLPLLAGLPYARAASESGLAKPLVTSVTPLRGVIATIIAFAACYYLDSSNVWEPFVTACAVIAVSGWKYKREVGGITGDLLGACNVVTETSILVLLSSKI